jgi:oxalate decarboxylase
MEVNMSKLSRREVVAGAAVAGMATTAGGSLVYAQVDRPTEGPPSTALAGQNLPSFRYALGEKAPLEFAGGSLSEATVDVFPVSDRLAGALMVLDPGGLRELHWHANYGEWAYVIEGKIRGTGTTGNGQYQTADFGPGDVWYFPTGFGHSLLNIGDTPARAILVFDNGFFADYGIFSITGWTSWVSPAVLAKNFGMPEATFANFPKEQVVIAKGPVPPMSGGMPPAEVSTAALDHRYALLDQSPEEFPGGTRRVVSQTQFPVSTTMSGGLLHINPGGMRALHWHPNSAELRYFLK